MNLLTLSGSGAFSTLGKNLNRVLSSELLGECREGREYGKSTEKNSFHKIDRYKRVVINIISDIGLYL